MNVTAKMALHLIPEQLKSQPVFLCIDDTIISKFGTKFENVSKLFDHATHNGCNYLNGHCFVIKTTDKDIAKTELLAKGFREAGQTVTNAFRTFADKPEVDYSQKEQKHPITKAVLAPMKAVKKMLVLMEIHLDASIDKLDNLAMDVQLDKEKHMENAKAQKQTEPERAEAERVEAEVVYAPMVAEPQEYQYNADAFEARGVDEVKQEAAHKEAPKVRDDKAR